MGYSYERSEYSYSRVAASLAQGKSFENDSWRIHRLSDAIRVTDLTNAGRRGKRVVHNS